jgi:hypothetical protein
VGHPSTVIKTMLKFFWTFAERLRRRAAAGLSQEEEEKWRRDPLSHPVLARMDMRTLADLPMAAVRQVEETTDRGGNVVDYSAARRRLPRNPPDCRRHKCA